MLLLEKDWDALKQLVSGSLDKSIFGIIDEMVRWTGIELLFVLADSAFLSEQASKSHIIRQFE